MVMAVSALMGEQLFASKMYAALGPRWASTVVGCVAIAMVPIPFALRRYVHRICVLTPIAID